MKKLLLFSAGIICCVAHAEIVYMQGSVYYAQDPGLYYEQNWSGGPNQLFLNVDSQLETEMFLGGEYLDFGTSERNDWALNDHGGEFFIDVDHDAPFSVHTSLRIFSQYGAGVSEADSSAYANAVTYANPNFVTSERYFKFYIKDQNFDRYYGWIRWDGSTFAEYAFESISNQPIAVGAIPEPSSVILLVMLGGGGWFVRRFFPVV